MKVNELLTLTIEDVVPGGQALARHEGRVVFVDRGLPGDRVQARLARIRRRWADARLESIEEGCPERVAAPCPHVQRCGGCRLQELDYAAQCRLKERHVRETLQHLGGIAAPDVRPLVPARSPWRYRNKMEFTFAPAPDGTPRLGMHERGWFDRVFAIEDCFLPSTLTVEIVKLTQRWALEHRWEAHHPRFHTGVARHLVVRHLPHTSECAVHLVATSDALAGLADWARAVAALSPDVKGVTWLRNTGRANVATGDAERVLFGRATIVERLLGLEFEAGSASFLQTNSAQAEALYRGALAAADAGPGDTVLDLYCGTGTLTLLFARVAREAIGVESVEPAVDAAHANAARNGIANARFVAGESRAVLRAWARGEREGAPRPGIVVVDPPRAGLHPRVVARVAELAPRRVVYVSCNPGTFARDVKDFAGHGYVLDHVVPYDLFPHTPHIECVARLVPRGA